MLREISRFAYHGTKLKIKCFQLQIQTVRGEKVVMEAMKYLDPRVVRAHLRNPTLISEIKNGTRPPLRSPPSRDIAKLHLRNERTKRMFNLY